MLTIPEGEVPGGCDMGASGAGLGILRLDQGLDHAWLVIRHERGQPRQTRLAQPQHQLNLDSVRRVPSVFRCDVPVAVEAEGSAWCLS
jgi:hypothetical protein